MKIQKSFIKVKEMNITLYESSKGKSKTPILLLHGGGLDSALLSYGSVIATLGEKYHVIAPDMPGYGDSDKPDAYYTLEWYQDFLKELINVLNYDKVDLGGLSLGGGISLGYSIRNPEKIRKLILIAPYGLTDEIPYASITSWLLKHPRVYDKFNDLILSNKMLLKANLKKIMVNPDSITDEIVNKLMEVGKVPETGRAWRKFQLSEINGSKLRTCYTDQLHHLKMPVLLLTGKNDSLVPSNDVEKAHSLIKNSKLIEFDNCGHWLPRDKSKEFIQTLDDFLAK